VFTTFEEVLQEISPQPKCKIIRQRKRKAKRAEVLTASPFKQRLLKEIASKKTSKASANSAVGLHRNQQKKKDTKKEMKNTEKKKKKMTCRADKPTGRKPKVSVRSEQKASCVKVRSQAKGRVKKGQSSARPNSDSCLICGEPYFNSRGGERWIPCQSCLGWCHEDCTGGEVPWICL